MTNVVRSFSAVAVLVAVSIAGLHAEDNGSRDDASAAADRNSSATAPASQQHRAKQILGARVNLDGDREAGTVDDIVFDENGTIEYLVVANSESKLVTVPWEAAKFNVEKRTAVIHIAPEQFQQIPTYTTEQYPSYWTPTYRTQIYKYYGLTPKQQRKLQRQEERRRDD